MRAIKYYFSSKSKCNFLNPPLKGIVTLYMDSYSLPRHMYWASAIALYGILAFFSFNALTESPPTWFDEGIYLQVAMNNALHGAQEIQLAPNSFASTAFVTGGYPFLKPISWSFSFFSFGVLQARLVMVLFIFACVSAFFFLSRALFGNTIALLTLLLLVTFPPLYGQGKNVLGEVPGLFFLAVFLFSVHALEKRAYEGPWWYILAGITAGLCVSTKPIFFLIGGAVLIAILLHRHRITFRWNQIAVGVCAFLVPLSYWLFQQFGQGDTVAQVLGYYANPYDVQNLNAQMLTNALRFVHETSPMYFLGILATWVASCVIRLWRRLPISFTETVAISFSLLVLVAYLRTAGWYRYYFVAEIPALVFFPFALQTIARTWKNSYAPYLAIGVALLLVLVQSYQLLFTSWVAVHASRTTTHELQTYMATLPSESTYFFYNVPAAVIFLPSQNYYQYLELTPIKKLGVEFLPLLKEGTPGYVITDGRRWQGASSTFSHYSIIKTIDDLIIAKRN